jgi:hypothetical protein
LKGKTPFSAKCVFISKLLNKLTVLNISVIISQMKNVLLKKIPHYNQVMGVIPSVQTKFGSKAYKN